jgi:DNA-binding CsgD family transcriptional regulator
LDQAVEILKCSPSRLEQARTLVELGAALRRANRRAEAREHLRSGLDLAQRCGATRLAARAQEELLASGARARRLVQTGAEALTPSEIRVARMAASGKSNPQIGQALFITRNTVETHLRHIYQKLGISTRDELTRALETSPDKTPSS